VNKRAQPPTEIGTITRMSAIPIVACRRHTIFMKIAGRDCASAAASFAR
jgi:hypothetical protein